ncbi:MAG TPA: peptidoglycan-binding domain-containing protein, partial [Planctomycetota bacterium]|nr:peptidoglycan-binding domain-containing protein [Planctomycetota bacterium]
QGTYLRSGAAGAEVTALQNALAGSCHAVPLTAKFDSATLAAVEAFQAHFAITVDGVVGPQTMKAFDTALGIGKSPSPGLVRISQSQVTPQITAAAVAILNAHWSENIGTEYPFTANGAAYVGRIELHYHPFGGSLKPWGYHHGVSVYAVTGKVPPAPAPTPAPAGKTPVKGMLPRPANALTGSQFMAQTASLSLADRETQIWNQLSSGNVPSFLRSYVDVTVQSGGHTLVFHVLPDYMAIGSDDDFVRIPMWAPTAQRVADLWGGSVPTTKMVDLIWQAAQEKIAPVPLTPSAQMEDNAYFLTHQRDIEAELVGKPRGELVGGDKKDIVITNQYRTHPTSVAIYGWHQLNGQPIQPLTTVHAATYADYSHGVRLVDLDVTLDGQPAQLDTILEDPTLSSILSNEGAIASPRIP